MQNLQHYDKYITQNNDNNINPTKRKPAEVLKKSLDLSIPFEISEMYF
jgi:hypothetical protein